MQRGWGDWSPLEHELEHLPNGWDSVSAEQQCSDRPYDYLPDLELVLEWAGRCSGPVLDLACGNGRLALALGQRGYDVVGLDLNAQFVQRAREEAERQGLTGRVRFEVGDARDFRLPERFGLIVMMDQAFKYLLRHDEHLDCLHCVREHLRDEGRFLVEHRCLFRLPDHGPGDSYAFDMEGREWVGVDSYDAIQQVGVSAFQPADEPEAPSLVQPCRDFTYQELELLHRVVGLEPDAIIHDLDERTHPTTYFDVALVLRKTEPWRPRSSRQ